MKNKVIWFGSAFTGQVLAHPFRMSSILPTVCDLDGHPSLSGIVQWVLLKEAGNGMPESHSDPFQFIGRVQFSSVQFFTR